MFGTLSFTGAIGHIILETKADFSTDVTNTIELHEQQVRGKKEGETLFLGELSL